MTRRILKKCMVVSTAVIVIFANQFVDLNVRALSESTASLETEGLETIEEIGDTDQPEIPEETEQLATEALVTSAASLDTYAAQSGYIKDIFPDPTIAQSVADDLGKSIDDYVSQDQLNQVLSIYAMVGDIENIEGVQHLQSIIHLYLERNSISDLSALENADFPNMLVLSLYENQISDISPLRNVTMFDVPLKLALHDQSITLDPVPHTNSIVIQNIVKDLDGNLIAPKFISNNGVYDGTYITWSGLPEAVTEVTYEFEESVPIGFLPSTFSGTVTQPLELVVRVKVSFNGNGGIPPLQNETAVVGDTYADTIAGITEPTRTNYTFVGWFTAPTGGTEVTGTTVVTETSDHTLYA